MTSVACVAMVCVACGDPGGSESTASPAVSDDPSGAEPFAVGDVPAGYRLVAAGTGTRGQSWGDDSEGTNSPTTVLRDGDRIAVVTTFGYEGSQSGFGYDNAAPGTDRFRVDGDPAISFSSPDRGTSVSVDRGDDMAITVESSDATKDELIEIARAVRPPEDHLLAPEVPDPPAGWTVVGSVAADVVIALSSWVRPNSDDVPGSTRSYGAAWLAGGSDPTTGEEHLVVVSMPADAVDLEALLTSSIRLYGETIEATAATVQGRPAVAMEMCVCELDRGIVTRAVVSTAFDHSVVMVVAVGNAPPSPEQMLATAESVTPATPEEWEQFQVAAAGGPGLHPDEGRTVLATGTVDGLDWLLQTRPTNETGIPDQPATIIEADPCLKLSNRKRVCADAGGGSAGETVRIPVNGGRDFSVPGFPEFVVVTTRTPGAGIRVQTPADTGTGELHQVPGSDTFAGIVFVDGPGLSVCSNRPGGPPTTSPDIDMKITYVDITDAEGNVIGCPGGFL